MPVPTHFKFTIRGDFLGSPETWSYGMHFTRTNLANEDATYGDIDEGGITDAVVAWHGSSYFSELVEVRDWRMYEIGTDGKMQTNAPLLHEFDEGECNGSSTAAKFPTQCSIVVSSIAVDRGPAQRGRFYLPGINTSIGDDWLLSDSVAGVVRGAATTFVKAVSDQIDLDGTHSSEGCNISPGPPGSSTGTLQVIDHYEVGRVVDTVRNRRRSLQEQYNVGGHVDW